MAAKKKRLTQKEKKQNAEIKKELQEKGIIPPDKPRLNRRNLLMGQWRNGTTDHSAMYGKFI